MRQIDSRTTPFDQDLRIDGSVSGVHIAPPEDPALHAYVVHFEPGGRTAWHCHEKGQLLICTDGRGVVGTRDGTIIELMPGISVWTDPGEDHWHGATSDQSMTHIAVQTQTTGVDAVTWQEPASESLR